MSSESFWYILDYVEIIKFTDCFLLYVTERTML